MKPKQGSAPPVYQMPQPKQLDTLLLSSDRQPALSSLDENCFALGMFLLITYTC
jgi:hypothetical protein